MNKIENYKVIELNYTELTSIDGGCWFYDLWQSIKEGFVEGFNDGSGANCN